MNYKDTVPVRSCHDLGREGPGHEDGWQSLWGVSERDISSEAAPSRRARTLGGLLWRATLEEEGSAVFQKNKRLKAGDPARAPDIYKTSQSMQQEGVYINKLLIISPITDSLQSLI